MAQCSPSPGRSRVPGILQNRTRTLRKSNDTVWHYSTSLEFCTKHPRIPRIRNGRVLDVPVHVGAALAGTARPRWPTEAHNDASTRPTWTSRLRAQVEGGGMLNGVLIPPIHVDAHGHVWDLAVAKMRYSGVLCAKLETSGTVPHCIV